MDITKTSNQPIDIMEKSEKKQPDAPHAPDCNCSLCGKRYHNIAFKSGYVCEECVGYIKKLT